MSKNLIENETIEGFNLEGIDSFDSLYLNCVFKGVNLSAAWFSGSIFETCEFVNCNLTDTDWSYSTLRGCNFRNCFLGKAEFFMVQMSRLNFNQCDFRKSEISNCIIYKTSFSYKYWPGTPKISPRPNFKDNHTSKLTEIIDEISENSRNI